MSEQETGQIECPFSGHDEVLLNVKFFRGHRNDVISADEMLQQARSAVMQHRMRTATISTMAPVSNHPAVDVRDFVQSL